jgi:isoleucyl-tRNA synthetase
VDSVVTAMDAYDNFSACARITAFVDALSNWYVRRSRDRFWASGWGEDKEDAYWTLYECLLVTTKLVAPFVPFLAEELWQNLARGPFGSRVFESVHLCDYPAVETSGIDQGLSQRMNLVRDLVSLGRSARMGAKLKVRQPLARVECILADSTHQAWLEDHAALVAEELNVKLVEFVPRADQYVNYTVLPDLKRLGPRLGKRLPLLKDALKAADPLALVAGVESGRAVRVTLPDGDVDLDPSDVQIRLEAKPGWAAAHGPAGVVVLSTQLDEDLMREGLAREVVHAIQGRRKELQCDYTDRIAVGVETDSPAIQEALRQFSDYIQGETLALQLSNQPLADVPAVESDLGGHAATLYVRVVQPGSAPPPGPKP